MAERKPTTILVPLDGSAFAETALRPAVAFAARVRHARVELLSCGPAAGSGIDEYLRDRARRFEGVVDVGVRVATGSHPSDAILGATAATSGALVCMATRAYGGLRSVVAGSVAEQVMCRSAVPVVVVGPRCRTTLLVGEVADVVVCSDGSPFSAAVLPHAREWAGALALRPTLVEVVGPDETVVGPDQRPRPSLEVEAAAARLDALVPRLGAVRAPVRTEVLAGQPVRTIADYAERLPAGLVAMATHGRSGFALTAVGSVAAQVARRAACPVLLVRPESSGPEAAG